MATILDSWVYHIGPGPGVLTITYGCTVDNDTDPVLSHEHRRIGLFGESEVPHLAMPDGYKRSIAAWYRHLRAGDLAYAQREPEPRLG